MSSRTLPFLILPFFLCLGIAGQALGFYVFGLILPLILYRNELSEPRKHLFLLCGVSLFLAWGCFVASNVVHAMTVSEPVILKDLFRSPFSSAVLIASVVWTSASFFPSKQDAESSKETNDVLSSFTQGVLIASSALFLYTLVQHLTGFEFRVPGNVLAPEHALNGRYRIFGLYGHPLSMAAASLAVFAFYWPQFLFANRRKQSEQFKYLTISFLQFAMIWMSGGRTAFLVALVFVAGSAMFLIAKGTSGRRKNKGMRRATVGGLLLILGLTGIGGWFLWPRIAEVVNALNANQLPDRIRFWHVHWKIFLEHPWFGIGYANLEAARPHFYESLGYAALRDKFNAHNFYLETLAAGGLFALSIVVTSARSILVGFRVLLVDKALYTGLLCALVANAIHGITQNVFFDSNVIYWYLALITVALFSRLNHQNW